MVTVVNTPQSSDASSNGIGFLLGMVMLMAMVFFLFYYGAAMLRGALNSGPSVNVPDRVDVNVNGPTP